MARVTPEQFREKHARRLKGSLEDIVAGVQNVTTAPGVKAAEKADKMKANLVRRIDDGTWGRRVAGVSLDEWKNSVIEKGVNRIPAGIDAAAGKVEAFASQLLPHIDRGVAELDKMPDLTLEDSIARMTKFTRHMSKFRKK